MVCTPSRILKVVSIILTATASRRESVVDQFAACRKHEMTVSQVMSLQCSEHFIWANLFNIQFFCLESGGDDNRATNIFVMA